MRRVVLLEEHHQQLRDLLFPDSGHEAIAYVLCGQVSGTETRYLSHRVLPLPDECVRSSSATHVTAETTILRDLLKTAAEQHLTVIVVHSHRPGPAMFSSQDDADEPKLIELAQHRNGVHTEILSMIIAENGEVTARLWRSPKHYESLSVIGIGERITGHAGFNDFEFNRTVYARQLLALGPAFQRTLAALRFGVVGAGATGSATTTLLARLGVMHLVIVDDDRVESSNLNRLHGATPDDARFGRSKVEAQVQYLKSFRPDLSILPFDCLVDEQSCRDALTQCDVVFGCTDDHDGRTWLNRLAYFYSIPVIDMGIGIDFEPGDPPRVLDVAARVTVVGPGHPCLLCRGVIDPEVARADALRRQRPKEYERLRDEAYIRGAGLPNPAVVSYTTEVACMAVDELIERLTGYRQIGPIAHRLRKFRLGEDKCPGFAPASGECQICMQRTFWGRGDVVPFMDRLAA